MSGTHDVSTRQTSAPPVPPGSQGLLFDDDLPELDDQIGVTSGDLGADESKKELPKDLESHDRSWER